MFRVCPKNRDFVRVRFPMFRMKNVRDTLWAYTLLGIYKKPNALYSLVDQKKVKTKKKTILANFKSLKKMSKII